MAENFSQLAKDFIDRANGGSGLTGTWRLEVLQKRLSSNADGTPKDREIPVRIRRFLKGIPWAQVHDAIRYLISKSPYKGIIYNGIELDGEYRPTLTQWRRDDQEQVGGNAQGSYTLIQDLIEVTDDGDSLDTVSADSCSETEETTWVWDAPEIEELPDNKGKQGETYAIRQVRRNEDGTFDYAIVRQVAKTKISGWKVTECDEYSTVRVRIFDNVYGGLFDGDPFTDGTTVLRQIPAPCKTDNGTLVQVSVAQNPDCTFRVTVQETVAKQNVEKTSETRKGPRGVVTSETTVATNSLPETDLELGEQVRNELRPDGLYDVTHVTVAKEPVGDIGSSCETTVFEHRHVESENVPDRPEKEASSAGDGKTYQVQSRVTEEGTWDVTRTETTEIAVMGAQRMKQKTLRGVTETTVDRNVDNSDVSVTNIGDRIQVEQTPGGKYNRTVTTVTTEAAGEIAKDCQKTVFEHTDETVTNQLTEPADKEASAAGSGKTYRKTTRKTDEGTFDVTEQETTEEPVSNAVVQYRKTLRGTIQTTTDRNQEQPLAGTGLAVGETRRSEKTPGGRYNNTTEAVTPEAAGKIVDGLDKETVKSTTFVTNNQATDPGTITLTAEVNKSKRKVSRKTDAANWDVEEQETDYTPVQTSKTWTDERGTHVYCSYRNQTQPLTPGAPDGGGTWTNTTARFSENDHGSFDGSYTCFQVAAPSEAGKTLQYETEANVSTKFYYQKAGGEMVYRNITGTRHLAYGQAKHIMSEIKGAEECALVGWRTSVGDGPGIVSAHWYTGIVVGNESKLSSSSQEA